jgi:5-formyltetrahydrofolate cyclo-ligase
MTNAVPKQVQRRAGRGKPAPDAIARAKSELRAAMRDRVAAIRRFMRDRRAQAVASAVVRAPALAGARCVLAYRALADEIDVDPLVRALRARGVRVAFPRVNEHGTLELLEIAAADPLATEHWSRDRLGIASPRTDAPGVRFLAPIELDAVIVPGRAFDARGARLGRGKGFYDDLIARLRPDARRATVGVCHREQLVDAVPESVHDRRVAFVAVEGRLIRGARKA